MRRQDKIGDDFLQNCYMSHAKTCKIPICSACKNRKMLQAYLLHKRRSAHHRSHIGLPFVYCLFFFFGKYLAKLEFINVHFPFNIPDDRIAVFPLLVQLQQKFTLEFPDAQFCIQFGIGRCSG